MGVMMLLAEIDLDHEGALIVFAHRLADAVALLDLLGSWLFRARFYLALPDRFELRELRELRDLLDGLSLQLHRRASAMALARLEAAGELSERHRAALSAPPFLFRDVSRASWPEF